MSLFIFAFLIYWKVSSRMHVVFYQVPFWHHEDDCDFFPLDLFLWVHFLMNHTGSFKMGLIYIMSEMQTLINCLLLQYSFFSITQLLWTDSLVPLTWSGIFKMKRTSPKWRRCFMTGTCMVSQSNFTMENQIHQHGKTCEWQVSEGLWTFLRSRGVCVWVLSGGRHWPDKNSIWWGLSSRDW